MNKQIKTVTTIFIILFCILIGNVSYIILVRGPTLASHQANTRVTEKELNAERGEIITSDDVVLATSKRAGSRYKRTYPEGQLAAHIVGYSSSKYEKAGIEKAYNDTLLGYTNLSFIEDLIKKFEKDNTKGNSVILTIDSKLQKQAEEDLSGKTGAVVALDPKTGAVLAMASSPSFNPSEIDEKWKVIEDRPDAPLVNRAIQGSYPPGSSFKIITTSAAIEEQLYTPDDTFYDEGIYEVLGTTIRNYGDRTFGEVTFRDALEMSINTVFAQIGLTIGADRLVEFSNRFGFNKKTDFDLPVKESSIPNPRSMDEVDVAWSAIGQAKVLVTPLEMAMATATIANNGALMQPYVVEEIRNPKGQIIKQYGNEKIRDAISAQTAETVSYMMVGVVEDGTGAVIQMDEYQVGAKTGTAEIGTQGETHAWFVAFAPANDPVIAVAVIVEKGGRGGEAAGPIARRIVELAVAK